jgi:putative oxidoreductase
MNAILRIRDLHNAVFAAVERAAGEWFLPFAARLVFLAVLFFYFLNSWGTKVEGGITGFFAIKDGAYYQIVPWAVEAAGGDPAQVGFLDHLVVLAGTVAEFVLPVLIVAGLFTRVASLGMMAFVAVQTWVDVTFHGVAGDTLGALFDRFSDSLVADQRTLWAFLLAVLVVKGGGALSLDAVLSRLGGAERPMARAAARA